MANKDLITLAYEIAKTKYAPTSKGKGAKTFTFQDLWKELIRKCKLSKEEQQNAGRVYADLLQDHRFIFIGNEQWMVREFLTEEEQTKFSNSLYDFENEVEDEDIEKDEDNFGDYYSEEDAQENSLEVERSLDDEEETDDESEDNSDEEIDEESEEDEDSEIEIEEDM